MKFKRPLLTLILIFICALTALFAGCGEMEPPSSSAGNVLKGGKGYVSEKIGIDLSVCTLISDTNTDGKPLECGGRLIVMDCMKDMTFHDAVLSWHYLSKGDNVYIRLYGDKKENSQYYALKGVPEFKHVRYYFYDKLTPKEDPEADPTKDDRLLEREEYSFWVALYDMDENNLYFFEI